MAPSLIYDIGLHDGGDTAYYLASGHRVVAVDADARFVEQASRRFAAAIRDGQLHLVHAAITDVDGDGITFFLSETTDWNSMHRFAAERGTAATTEVTVRTRRLDRLFAEYGVPEYCKIDIEGADALALRGLLRGEERPRFISVEAECIGEGEWTEARSIETLDLLRNLGYTKFKLVDQPSLAVLAPQTRFYYHQPALWRRALHRLGIPAYRYWTSDGFSKAHRLQVSERQRYAFLGDVSGPWGNDLAGEWVDYATARASYLAHRRAFFQRPSTGWAFWVDWHASR